MVDDLRCGSLQDRPEFLEPVVELGKRFSGLLGFMPKGAFEQAMGRVLIVSKGAELAGYLMYRVVQRSQIAVIVHLCVAREFRRQGLPEMLFEELKNRARQLAGVRVRCRRDYDANKLWPRLGFRFDHPSTGRGADAASINVWWYPLERHGLFSTAADVVVNRQVVVVDANVFFDFYRDTEDSYESRALLEDWVAEFVDIKVTAEISVDIDRSPFDERRRRGHSLVKRFEVVEASESEFLDLVKYATEEMGKPRSPRDESDIRHIAHAAASRVSYLVTRDAGLLEASDRIEARFGFVVLRPSELVSRIDSLERDVAYQPYRFEGSALRIRVLEHIDEAQICSNYLATERGERKYHLLRSLRRIQSRPKDGYIIEVYDQKDGAIAVAALDRSLDCKVEVATLRATKHPLSQTVLRQILSLS